VHTVVQIPVSAYAKPVLLAAVHLITVACVRKAAGVAYHTAWTTSQLISVSSLVVIAVREWVQDTTCAIQDTADAALSVISVKTAAA
jgi:hypothetical protein